MYRQIAGKLAGWGASRQLKRFFDAAGDPSRAQKQMLARQLTLLSGSDFARDHRLATVDTYDDFVRRVPIRRYEEFGKYIEPLKLGRTEALFARDERLVMFAMTSGTTGQAKHIPVTRRSLADYRRGWNVFGLRALVDHPSAFFRKIVQVTSPMREEKTPGGHWCGAITGLLAETQKWIVRKHYVTPPAVAGIKDPLAKSYTVVRLALTEDVSFISTANPSTVLRLAQTMAAHSDQLIRDVHAGELTPPGDLPTEVADVLKSRLKPNRRRANQLEAICSKNGALLPKDVWNLAFLANWTGGTLKLYLSRFPEFFGNVPIRDIGLLASEGRFSIPIEDNTPAGILELTGNLLEFIPEQDYGQSSPTVLRPEQLKVGERYFLILSNATGLTRYDIGDLVEVVDFYRRTPMIAFLSKGSHISSVTGEKLSEHQIVEAMDLLSQRLNRKAKIDNFLVCPHWSDPPYYALTLEHSVSADHGQIIQQEFDAILQKLNIEYQAKRASLRLGPCRLQRVPDGFFQGDDLKRLACGGRSEQYKRKFLLTQIDGDKDLPIG